MARNVQVSDIIAQVRARCDIVGALNPPDSETGDPGILSMVNASFPRFYDLLVEAFGTDYYFSTATLTAVTGVADLPLPLDFYKTRFVDLLVGNGARLRLERCSEDMLNAYSFGMASYVRGGDQILLSYTPVAPVLSQYASLALNSENGIDGIVFTAVAAGNLGASVKVAIVAGSGLTTVAVSGYTITITLASGGDTLSNILAAYALSQPALSLATASTLTGLSTDSITAAVAATALGGTLTWDFVNGWERYLVADVSAQVLERLDRDPSAMFREQEGMRDVLAGLAQTRDSGHGFELKDEETERAGGFPWAPTTLRGYRYREQGANLHIVPLVPFYA